MKWLISISALLCIGCTVPQPESAKTVESFEVPLPSSQERAEFLVMLSAAAAREGFHVDAATPEQLADNEIIRISVNATIWRGDDEEVVASAMDIPPNYGRPWISFSRGSDPQVATRFRQALMQQVASRWPETRSLPVMPSGTIPLPRDLVRMDDGYRVRRDAASRYGLPLSSPLIAPN